MLNYPLAFQNPRGPLFPWFSLLVGRLVAPLFGDPWNSVMFVWLLSTALFGSLAVFPTYALAKEAFGRKAGLISAFLLAISVGNLQRSAATDADHDTFTLFFVISTFFFFLRALKTMNRRRWVEGWFHRKAITSGLRAFFRENRTSVLYAALSGLCVAVIALAWQGWAYVAVILIIWFAVELFLARFRNEDTMGTWILFAIALTLPVILAFQWYYVRVQIRVWFDVPAYLFLAALVLGFAFTVTRDYPWTLVIPGTLIAAGVAVGVGVLVNPSLLDALVSGAGYFIPSKVVTTIAEDQSPGMSQMILSFGLFTFGMSLLAMAYLLWQVPRRRDPAYSLIVVWAFVAIFMAMTGARFIFDASPAFAVTAGFAIDQVLVRADFATMRRTYRSLAAGSWRNALRKSVKARHVLAVLGIVFLVLLPNVWWAVDASIPFELKSQYDKQLAALLPSFLRSPGYSPSSTSPFYFGAFGYSIPKPTEYYPAAWSWFATQDKDRPAELRPAFLSWWDYGFEATDRGVHPTVADNFQNGYAIAGQFITAQNETEAISLLVVRLLEGDMKLNRPNFSPGVSATLAGAGLPVDVFRSAILHPADYISPVLSNPVLYGAWAPDMQPLNAEYVFLTHLLTRQLDLEGVVSLYRGIREATGWEIGYFAVDSRLFPISVQNTGIFYAPVKLSDHRILALPDGRILPFEFFQIYATTNRGSNIPIQDVAPGDTIQSQTIQYKPAFYNSMFYRSYIGYSPANLGSNDTGIPGFDQALQAYPPMPAWNLTHFRVVYRSSYYNPFPDPSNHTDAWRAMNYDEAQRLQANITAGTLKGVVDQGTATTVANGVVFLRYYDGAWVNGTVSAGSTPLPGVRITVTDELGTPHYVTTTDASGHYSALVPFGDITITASSGTITRTSLIGTRVLASAKVHVTVDQAMRSPADMDGDGTPDWLMTRDLQATPHAWLGTTFFDIDRNGAFGPGDVRASGAMISVTNKEFPFHRTATAALDGTYTLGDAPEGSYSVTIALQGRTLTAPGITLTGADSARDVSVPFSIVHGTTVSSLGGSIPAANVEFRDETNSTLIATTTLSDGSYRVGPLLAGNYTVTAASADPATTPTRTHTGPTDLALNLTLYPAGIAAGATNLFGNARPFATLEFRSAADPQTIRMATSNAGAEYSIRLAAGTWFVTGRFYDGTHLYATLGRVDVASGATAHFDAMFLDGVRVNGTVKDPSAGVQNPKASVAFSSSSGELWLRTDTLGRYLAFLPVGTYDLESLSQAGAYFASVTFSSDTRTDIGLLATSDTVAWRVYRDLNGNGVADAGEDIAGAHVEMVDDRGAHLFLTTPSSGDFPTPLFANRTYAGSVSAAGDSTRVIPASHPADLLTTVPIALDPTPVPVQGTVLLNGSALVNRPVTIPAVPLGNGAIAHTNTSDSNGGYKVALLPGADHPIVGGEVSTSPGLRCQNIALANATRSTGRALFQGVAVPGPMSVTFVRREGGSVAVSTDSAGAYSAILAPGNYSVHLNGAASPTEGGVTRFYRYDFDGNATVTPGQPILAYDLVTSRTLDNTTVAGTATLSGQPVDARITFTARGGGAITAPATTDANGIYSVSLQAGTYDVYATGTFASGAFLARISVPHAPSMARDLPLSPASLLSGVTTNAQGFATNASITIQSSAQLDLVSDAGGQYQALLPANGYALTAVKTGTENGIAVTYRAASSVALQADSLVNLPLAKVVSRSVALTWDASQRRQILAGDSVTYTIDVRNTGNVADTFQFSGTPADWQFSFTPSSVPLNFGSGATSTSVRVVVQSPANALVNHDPLDVVATSTTDASTAGDVIVKVDIERVRALSVALNSTAATFDGRFLNYTIEVKNAGNAREVVQVGITNPDELGAVGWSVSLGRVGGALAGTTLANGTVEANQTVLVHLQAQSSGGSSGATVGLVASPPGPIAGSPHALFTPPPPELGPGSITVTGPEITPAAPLNAPLIAVAAGAIAAVAAGLYLGRRRR